MDRVGENIDHEIGVDNGGERREVAVSQFAKLKKHIHFLKIEFPSVRSGVPNLGDRPPEGTREVPTQWTLGYICISGETQLVLGGLKSKKVGNPCVRSIIIYLNLKTL